MTRWYRAYVGTVTDPKLGGIAHMSGAPKCAVIAIWHFILERAAEKNSGGQFEMDGHQICATLDLDMEIVKKVWAGFIMAKMISDTEVLAWKKRQYETDVTDPTNAQRQRRWKEKHLGNGKVTAIKRPDTDTDTDTDTEKKEERKKDTGKILLPDSWTPSDSHFDLATERGLSREEVNEAVGEMRSWSLGNGEKRRNWDWVFNNWLRRNAARMRGNNGQGRPRPLQDDSLSASRAAEKLAQAAERGEFQFTPRPSLYPEKSESDIRLLPKGRNPGT